MVVLPTVLLGNDDRPLLIRKFHRNEEEERYVFNVQIEPRGMFFNVGLSLMTGRDDLAAWRLPEGTDGSDVAAALMARAIAADREGELRNRVWDGESFATSVISREPVTDTELVNYMASKIYWSWHFGLSASVISYSDEVLVGLVPRSESEALLPGGGQLVRAAQWGMKTFWDRHSDGSYTPTRKLLEGYPILPTIRGSLEPQ